jgi:PAS domain S-box-containing protein
MNSSSTGAAAIDDVGDELRRQSRLFAEVQEVAHIGVWEWEIAHGRVTWSPELYRIYALSAPEYTPTFEGYLEKVHPRDRARVRATLQRLFIDQKSFTHDERILRPDGSIRWLHTWGHALLDERGQVARMLGVCQDVTEQKFAEEQLRESERRYRLIVEDADEGIWIGDEAGRTIFTNARLTEMLGYSPDEMKGRSVFTFIARSHRSVAKAHLSRRRQGDRTHFDLELRHKKRLARVDVGGSQFRIPRGRPLRRRPGDRRRRDIEATSASPARRAERHVRFARDHRLVDRSVEYPVAGDRNAE